MPKMVLVITQDYVSIKEVGRNRELTESVSDVPLNILNQLKNEVRASLLRKPSRNLTLSSRTVTVSPLSAIYIWFAKTSRAKEMCTLLSS